jgi:hypothetical protein
MSDLWGKSVARQNLQNEKDIDLVDFYKEKGTSRKVEKKDS